MVEDFDIEIFILVLDKEIRQFQKKLLVVHSKRKYFFTKTNISVSVKKNFLLKW